MFIAIDTETTGLDLRHGCQPFFISTWVPEKPSPFPVLYPLSSSPLDLGLSEAPYSHILSTTHLPSSPEKLPRISTLEGYGYNWLLPYHPQTRKVSIRKKDYTSLAELLTGHTLVLHNAFFDFQALATLGIYFRFTDFDYSTLDLIHLTPTQDFPPPKIVIECLSFHDTMLACHLYDSKGPKGLKDAASHYVHIDKSDEDLLKHRVRELSAWAKKHASDWSYGQNIKGTTDTQYDYRLPITLHEYFSNDFDKYAELKNDPLLPIIYGSLDAYRTLSLHYTLQELLHLEDRTPHYIDALDHLLPCFRMQCCGTSLTPDLTSLHKKLHTNIFHTKKEVQHLAKSLAPSLYSGKVPFNPASPKQLGELLHSKEGLHLPVVSVTATGSPAVGASVRKSLADKYQKNSSLYHFLRLITSWEADDPNHSFQDDNTGLDSWNKAAGYLKSYQQYARTCFNGTRYVFPSYNATGTATTRYSSSNPNGQNISGKSKVPLRKAFGPAPGRVWFCIDYSQLELRLFASACKDPTLLSAFEEGRDFHELVACEMFSVSPDHVTSAQRKSAKFVNFGLIYGAGRPRIDSLAGFYGAYDRYCDNFPEASAYMTRMSNEADDKGYVKTLYGYPLHLGNDPSYKCVNYIVQGTAGGIVKYAMAALNNDKDSPIDWIDNKIILNVHDELVFDLPAGQPMSHYREVMKQIMNIMSRQGDRINTHTPVDCSIVTTNWQAKEDFHVEEKTTTSNP